MFDKKRVEMVHQQHAETTRQSQETTEHFRHVSIKLKMNDTSLVALDYENGSIGDSGTEKIMMALGGSTAVKTCHLSSNNIGPRGAECIASALAINSSITRLDLRANQLGVEGISQIGNALAQNEETKLRTLYLCNTMSSALSTPDQPPIHGRNTGDNAAAYALGNFLSSESSHSLCTLVGLSIYNLSMCLSGPFSLSFSSGSACEWARWTIHAFTG